MKIFGRLRAESERTAAARAPEYQAVRQRLTDHGQRSGNRFSERDLLRISALTGASYHLVLQVLSDMEVRA